MIAILKYIETKYPKFNHQTMWPNDLQEIVEGESIDYMKMSGAKKIGNNNFRSLIFYGTKIYKYDKPCIVMNSDASPGKQWFWLAHELGHFFLHFRRTLLDINEIKESSSDTNLNGKISELKGYLESQADLFACICLLPDTLLNEWYYEKCRAVFKGLITGEPDAHLDLVSLNETMFSELCEEASKIIKIEKDTFSPAGMENIVNRIMFYQQNIRNEIEVTELFKTSFDDIGAKHKRLRFDS